MGQEVVRLTVMGEVSNCQPQQKGRAGTERRQARKVGCTPAASHPRTCAYGLLHVQPTVCQPDDLVCTAAGLQSEGLPGRSLYSPLPMSPLSSSCSRSRLSVQPLAHTQATWRSSWNFNAAEAGHHPPSSPPPPGGCCQGQCCVAVSAKHMYDSQHLGHIIQLFQPAASGSWLELIHGEDSCC